MDFEVDDELLNIFITEASEALDQWEAISLNLKKQPSPENLNKLFKIAHSLKGTSKSMGFTQLGDFIHKVEDLIAHIIRSERDCDPNETQFLLTNHSQIANWLSALQTKSEAPNVQEALWTVDEYLKGNQEALEKYNSENLEHAKEVVETDDKKPKGIEFLRVRSDRLNSLIQIIGELSIHQSIISHCVANDDINSNNFRLAVHQAAKMTKEIQNESLALRMTEVRGLFQRLERTANDVAESLQKFIDVTIIGADQELDRSVVEAVQDPLVHIVRNAVDHGVEAEENRVADGKPARGQVKFEAISDAGGILLKLCDDGKGLDSEKILKKAIEKGLVTADDELSENEIQKLIFLPEFSTSDEVTDISGRGIGMQVVRDTITNIGVTINIQSKKGEGTEFHINLPASLNMIDAVVMELQGNKYSIPLQELVEIIDLNNSKIEHCEENYPLLSWRGSLVPLHLLSNELVLGEQHIADIQEQTNTKANAAMIIKSNEQLFGFGVDRIVGHQRIIVKAINGEHANNEALKGATILGDGKPSLILSLTDLSGRLTHKRSVNNTAEVAS